MAGLGSQVGTDFTRVGENEESHQRSEAMAGQIENIVNDLMRSFIDIFNGREFLRMQTQYSDFNPREFMSNYN